VQDADRVRRAIQRDFDPVRTRGFGGLKEPFMTRLEVQENGLDMFAGSEPVDAKIDAFTGELLPPEVADFDRVAQAAAGLHPEVRKDRMFGSGV